MKIDPNDTKKIEAAVKTNENPDEKKTEKPSSGFSAIKQKLSALFEKKTPKAQTEQKEKRIGEKTRPQGLKLNAKVLKSILIAFVSLTVLAMLYGVFKQRSLSFGGAQSEERLMTSVSPITIGQNDRIRSSGEGKTETVYINQGGGQNPAASGSAPTAAAVNPSQTAAATPGAAAAAQPFSSEVSRGTVTPAVIAEQTAALQQSRQPIRLVDNRQETDLSGSNAADSLDEARRSSLYPAGFDPKSVSIAAEQNASPDGSNPVRPQTADIVIAPYSTRESISPYQIFQGTIIPMVLVTGICSDLPGQITARVLSDIYDSVSGRYLIIPAGSSVVGNYSSGVMWGQQRVMVAWDRLIRPDGSSVFLGGMNGVDLSGYVGYKDKVDLHIKELAGLLAVSTIMNIASGQITYQAEKAQSDREELEGIITGATDSSIDATEAINSMAEKFLQLSPTLTIRAGTKCNLFVNKDIVLEPYMGY